MKLYLACSVCIICALSLTTCNDEVSDVVVFEGIVLNFDEQIPMPDIGVKFVAYDSLDVERCSRPFECKTILYGATTYQTYTNKNGRFRFSLSKNSLKREHIISSELKVGFTNLDAIFPADYDTLYITKAGYIKIYLLDKAPAEGDTISINLSQTTHWSIPFRRYYDLKSDTSIVVQFPYHRGDVYIDYQVDNGTSQQFSAIIDLVLQDTVEFNIKH